MGCHRLDGGLSKWWKHMSDVMPSNADHSPVSASLREVFHLP